MYLNRSRHIVTRQCKGARSCNNSTADTQPAAHFAVRHLPKPTLLVLLATNTSCAHAARVLVTGSVLLDSASQHPTQPQLSSQATAYATRQLAHLFAAAQHSPFSYLLSLFRYFSAGHSRIHICAPKLTCALHRLGVVARAGERGSRARSTRGFKPLASGHSFIHALDFKVGRSCHRSAMRFSSSLHVTLVF